MSKAPTITPYFRDASHTMNRRNFIRQSCFAAGASLLLGSGGLASRINGLRGGPAEMKRALAFARLYSGEIFFQGACVSALSRGVEIERFRFLVRLDNTSQFSNALAYARRNGFAKIHVHGATVSLWQNGKLFELENLPPFEFINRVAALNSGIGADYAHEALLLEPEQRPTNTPATLLDSVRLLRPLSQDLEHSLKTVLSGYMAAGEYALIPGSSFIEASNVVLAKHPSSREEAFRLAETFMKALPCLATVCTADTVRQFWRSHLIASSLPHAGYEAGDVINRFERLRAQRTANDSDAALWIAAAMSASIHGSTVRWADTSSAIASRRSSAAIARANQILKRC